MAATDTSCASGWLCMWQPIYRGGAKLAFYYCNTQNLGNYYISISAGNSWRDAISSIWNNQTGGVVSYFCDWKLVGYRLVGSLSTGNYLQDLTRDRAVDGGNWNDRIDQVSVCNSARRQGGAPMRPANSSATGRWGVRRLTVLGLVGLLVAVMLASQAAAVGPSQPSGADWPPYLADSSDPAVTTLASDLGISIREAQRRIGWQGPAIELAGELDRALGDRYGDLWIDPADGGRVKVGVVGGGNTAALAARLVDRRKLTSVTDLVPVRDSYAELKRAETWLTAEVARANPPASNGMVKGLAVWRLPDRNMVELSLPRGQRLTADQRATVAEARRRLGDMLSLGSWAGQMHDLACAWRTTTFDCDPPLRGGVMLYVRNAGGGYDAQCTAGFNARSTVDGKWYVMTAGHCGAAGQTFYVYQHRTNAWHVLGHMHNRVWAGDDDFGIITIDNVPGWNPQPWVYVHPSADTEYNPTYPITGTQGSWLGLRVCVSGARSGSDCGNVEALGGGSLARVDLCAEKTDSGAPIFSLGKARGLLKGANMPDPGQDPPGPCEDRLYQGLPEAAQRLHVVAVHT